MKVTKKSIIEKCNCIQGSASGLSQVTQDNFYLVKAPLFLHKYTDTGAVLFNSGGGHLICEFKPEYKKF